MNKRIVLAAIAASVLVLTGCSSASITAEKSEESVARAVGSIRTAEKAVEGTAFELDNEGKGGWQVEIVNNGEVTEVRTNPKGTEVKRQRKTGRIDIYEGKRLESVTVSLADAITIAAGETKGYVMGAELDRYRTTVVWEIEFDSGKEGTVVSVDATTGKVVNVEVDD